MVATCLKDRADPQSARVSHQALGKHPCKSQPFLSPSDAVFNKFWSERSLDSFKHEAFSGLLVKKTVPQLQQLLQDC